MRVRALTAFAFVLLTGCGGRTPAVDVPAARSARGRTVVVVRHAEKAAEGGKDPALSERGQARAQTLATMLGSAGVTKILATAYTRTQQTVTPLSQRTSIPIESMPPEKMREAIDAAPDGSFIVAATHSNVIPRLVHQLAETRLRGVDGDLLAEDDFSRVIVIARPCGAPKAIVTELSSNVE